VKLQSPSVHASLLATGAQVAQLVSTVSVHGTLYVPNVQFCTAHGWHVLFMRKKFALHLKSHSSVNSMFAVAALHAEHLRAMG